MLSDETFTIAETARRTGLTTHTLRHYEQQGLMLDWVKRAESTHRRYSAGAIAWIDFLTKLRATGMSIRRMREYAQLVGEGKATSFERLALLDEHRANVRAQLTSMQGTRRARSEDRALQRRACPDACRECVEPGQLGREPTAAAASSR